MISNNQTPWEDRDQREEFDSVSSNNINSDYSNTDPEDELEDDNLDTDDELDGDWEDDDIVEEPLDATYPGEKQEEEPDEIPEKHESEHEASEYPHETEVQRPESGADTSYSESTDVTPPTQHEFPSVGNAQTDFVSRPHGRTTGRMVGHEPGTEGI